MQWQIIFEKTSNFRAVIAVEPITDNCKTNSLIRLAHEGSDTSEEAIGISGHRELTTTLKFYNKDFILKICFQNLYIKNCSIYQKVTLHWSTLTPER